MAASLFGLVCFDVRHQRHAVILVVAVYGYAAAWCLTHAIIGFCDAAMGVTVRPLR